MGCGQGKSTYYCIKVQMGPSLGEIGITAESVDSRWILCSTFTPISNLSYVHNLCPLLINLLTTILLEYLSNKFYLYYQIDIIWDQQCHIMCYEGAVGSWDKVSIPQLWLSASKRLSTNLFHNLSLTPQLPSFPFPQHSLTPILLLLHPRSPILLL